MPILDPIRLRPTTLVAVSLMLLSSPSAARQDPLVERFDAWVEPMVAARDLAGTALVEHAGRTVLHRSWGLADLERVRLNRPETRFGVGSITKQFTAAAVLQLVDDGKLRLDDTIADLLTLPPAVDRELARSISLRQLLGHSSGLARDVPETLDGSDLQALAARLLALPRTFEPGERVEYSNSGYVVLAAVVEATTGQPFERVVTERILAPLGLASTGFRTGSETIPTATGYDPGFGPAGLLPTPETDVRRSLGATGLASTPADLARWIRALAAGEVLSPESTRLMLEDQGAGRGFGTGIYRRGGRKVIGHDGVENGFVAFVELFPDDDLIVAFAGNIRTSAFEYLEDALPSLAVDLPLPEVRRPWSARPATDASLIGSFRVHDSLVIDIAASPEGLMLRGSGGYFTPLLQVERDRWFYPALYADIVVQRDDRGSAIALAWTTVQGARFEIPRIDTDDPGES